ncbi:UNVERIFIED_CONTAM: Expansin-like A2 [Sesamum radiatum]|uniref:Expansin-like A2 n=1 Tax=Sesamum radiatum TaxID=300843 RepID=A0AAW2MVE1_SESRA
MMGGGMLLLSHGLVCLVTYALLLPVASSATACLHQSKVAFFSKPEALLSGACGYGSLAIGFNGGRIAAAAPSIYKQGAACGACFQQRFHGMAKKGMGQDILKLGVIDVEYKRIACDYKDKNLVVAVEESSQNPNYLALKFLYQGGQTEIVAVDVAQVGSSNWKFMSRKYGAVWETSRVPNGALQLRFVVTSGFDGKWYWAKNVLPQDWKNGGMYDSGLQITDIAQEPCDQPQPPTWKHHP